MIMTSQKSELSDIFAGKQDPYTLYANKFHRLTNQAEGVSLSGALVSKTLLYYILVSQLSILTDNESVSTYKYQV